MPAQSTRLTAVIDHTKLTFAPDEDEATAIRQLCREAQDCGFYAVCVQPRHGAMAKLLLQNTPVKVATVIGFPAQKVELADEQRHPTIGNVSTEEKLAELRQSVADGVDELDVVLNVANFLSLRGGSKATDVAIFSVESVSPVLEIATAPAASPQYKAPRNDSVLRELQTLVQSADGRPVKVILETDLLSSEEIQAATRLCVDAGAAMVKTSTGMVSGGLGATVENIRLIRQTLTVLGVSQVGIKASGGIRTAEQAEALLDAGATRLGTSAGVGMVA